VPRLPPDRGRPRPHGHHAERPRRGRRRAGRAGLVCRGDVASLVRDRRLRRPDRRRRRGQRLGLGYGYQVWRGRDGFRLDGAFGQFALVLPDHDLVIAYQGATLDTQATLRAFWAFVAAVEVADAAGGADVAAGPMPPAGRMPVRQMPPCRRAASSATPGPSATGLLAADPFDGAALHDRADGDGWTLVLPGVGSVPVDTFWQEVSVTGPALEDAPAATHLRLATRGERRDDGAALVHLVDTTSPHRVIVSRDGDGTVHAGGTAPLGGGWEVLRAPASVVRIETRAAALLLDMDGTLVDSHAVVERLWTQWSLDHGVDPARTLR
jgi:hypothetical protein